MQNLSRSLRRPFLLEHSHDIHLQLLVRLGSLYGYGSVCLCVCLGGCMSETGGPAFPELGNVGHNSDWQSESGMTLRDYFAAKALAVWAGNFDSETAARYSYEMADAMLRARGQ